MTGVKGARSSHPLTTLMLSGVRDIVLVTSSDCVGRFTALLGNGNQWGLNLRYRVQDRPAGIADGLRIAAADLQGSDIVLILGDNIFFGAGLAATLTDAIARNSGATILGYQVANPSEFGVMTLDQVGRPIAIEQKPANPKSRIAVTGLYIYSADVLEIVEQVKPSARGELEITDVNRVYLEQGRLNVRILGRGTAWLDGGRPGDLYEASQFVKVMQERTGLRIACPEELAYRLGFIDDKALERLIEELPSPSDYRSYLAQILLSTQ